MNFETDEKFDASLLHLAMKYNMEPAKVLRRALTLLVKVEEQLTVGDRRLVIVDEGNNVLLTYKVFDEV